MKPPKFAYHAPATVEEALGLLAEHGDDAKVLAGGQSLMPLLSLRLARPEALIDLGGIASLSHIGVDDDVVTIGAMVTERDAERSDIVTRHLPLLAEALPHIGHVAIRNRGTVGGSIVHADAAAEIPAVMVALDASVTVVGPGGERTISAADLFQGHYTTAIEDDEILVDVRIPVTPPSTGSAFVEVARRHGDFALVGVAATVAIDGGLASDCRITLSGVGDRPIRATEAEAALVGKALSDETIALAASAAVAGLHPSSDVHGSATYRKHLAGVLVARALTTAAARATASQGATR